jgi:predicted ribosome quality control (RQC) complex YloA/Tae2 family protein
MHHMTNFEYSFIVGELSSRLLGKHFDRIRKVGDGLYRIKISNYEVICELGTRIHLTKYLEQTDQTDKFVEKVAKELENAKLKSIQQINKDRIIMFDFTKCQLVFEMFGEGNAVLVRDGVTITAVKYESWTGREIKPGMPYSPPKNVPTESLELSPKYIIVSLMKLPIGKDYVLEALSRAKIDEKKSGILLSTDERARLETELSNLCNNPTPVIFYDNNHVVDFGLTDFSKYKTSTNQKLSSLSEAADEYYSKVEKPNPKLEKLVSRLEKQQERLEELIQEEKTFKDEGDKIYSDYSMVENLIALARAGKFDELEKKYNAKIDKKEKSIDMN